MNSFCFFADLLRRRSGLVIGSEKLYLLETRLATLLHELGLSRLDDLAERLAVHNDPELEQVVVEAMATHETLFFRDGNPFQHLESVVVPAAIKRRAEAGPFRIWSAATATGQEAYSIAMIFAEHGITAPNEVEIIGTDLARKPLERARSGLYSQYEVQRGLSVHRLIKHFEREAEHWQIRPHLRAMCKFYQWNLLDDPALLGHFDVIFCRNVLLYFDMPTRKLVLEALARQLTAHGLLYLGAAEATVDVTGLLSRRTVSPPVFEARLPLAAQTNDLANVNSR